jgi:hypothetical protein
MTPDEIRQLEAFLTPEELAELQDLVAADLEEVIWRPLPGPQTLAYESEADVVGYGGAAGGGKTDLAVGKALTRHRRVAMFRRESPQLVGIIDRLADLLGSTQGYNGQKNVWRQAGPSRVNIEFGSAPNAGDETKHQGRPKDLLVLDEATNFLEAQARFLMGWVRTTVQGQRTQTLMTFNPPTDAEGRWIVAYFGPWLDKRHPLYPMRPGTVVWVAVVDGKDDWSCPDDPRRFVLEGGQRLYEFDPANYEPTRIITPQSRTFIPSRVSDNPYLMGTGYMTALQAMPEPLRSQMLNGDFEAGMEDGVWQVIPTAWAEAAMARWKPLPQANQPKPPMDSIGVDVARGGRDNTILAPRHGMWFDKLQVHPGKSTPDGPSVAGLVIGATRDNAVQHIDIIGVGASPYDFLDQAGQDVVGVNVSEASVERDKSGKLGFYNLRSQLVWRMREALDPEANNGIALPPDPRLLADLCAYTWRLRNTVIYVESREEIEKRIGRSPDWASAAILALIDTPKKRVFLETQRKVREQGDYNPLNVRVRNDYDPFRT